MRRSGTAGRPFRRRSKMRCSGSRPSSREVKSTDVRTRVLKEVGKVVVGREEETELLLVSLLARGHTLIDGAPGVSKTMLAEAITKCVVLACKRVQFTPDMPPPDIAGDFILNMKSRE